MTDRSFAVGLKTAPIEGSLMDEGHATPMRRAAAQDFAPIVNTEAAQGVAA